MSDKNTTHEHEWELKPGPLTHRYRCIACGVLGYARGNGMGQRRRFKAKVKAMKCTLKVKKGEHSTTCGQDALSEDGFGKRLCREHS